MAARLRSVGLGVLAAMVAGSVEMQALALEVLSTTPAPNALGITNQLALIVIVFDAPILLPPAGAVRVAGSMSGLHDKTLAVDGPTLRIGGFSRAFFPGEVVRVGLRSTVAAAGGGGTLAGGRTLAFTIGSTRCTPEWSDVTAYPAASIPYFIHGGDLDGDQRPDLAVPNEGTNDVSFFRNTAGNGSFPSHVDHRVGARPSSVYGDDFDNDGDQDLATADINSGTMTVLRNQGAGAFAPGVAYGAGFTTRQVHGGDLDGDNDVDLVATAYGSDEIYLFTNQGNGSFLGGPTWSTPGGPFAVRLADLDGDLRTDVAVAYLDVDSLEVFRNSWPSFPSLGRFALGNGPWDLAAADFDADGDVDLAAVTSFDDRIVVLRNDGTGRFPTRTSWPAGDFPLGVFAADLDGDGDVDATAASFNSGTVAVYHNDGAGGLVLSATLATTFSGSYAWAHDLDGDGDLDISAVDESSDEVFVYRNGGTAVDVEGRAPRFAAPSLRVVPNPLRRGSRARLEIVAAGSAGREIEVFDVAGRRVRRLAVQAADDGRGSCEWDGRDEAGRHLAAGRYHAVLRVGGRRLAAPLQIVP